MKNNSIQRINNKLGSFISFLNQKKIVLAIGFVFIYLLFYFLQDFSSQSLIAHDEGLYARRSRLVEESSNWFSSPFSTPHHKTLGSYWLIALSIKLFGNSELALRLPSILFSFICLFLTYLIAIKITNKKSALISVFSLSSMPIWIQYSRYASPDIPFLFCILLVIFSFLEFLDNKHNIKKYFYIFIAGLFISISFFIRSYMALVPILGLTPFLIYHLSRTRRIFRYFFSIGILFGFIPTFLSLYYAYKKFGIKAITLLFDFAKNQAIGTSSLEKLLYIPLKYIYLTFPVGVLVIILLLFTRSNNSIKYPLLKYFYPFSTLFLLLCMSTSYPHYYLILLPSISIIFADQVQSFSYRFSSSKIFIRYILLIFIILICVALIFLLFNSNFYLIDFYYISKLLVNSVIFLLMISFIFSIKFLFDYRNNSFNLLKFFYTICISQFLSLSILYNFGIIGNPNFTIKSFLMDKVVISITNSNTIYLHNVNSKIQTLLSYYLPSSRILKSSNDIIMYDYIITADKELLNDDKGETLFKLIKSFDSHYLLMNISK